MRGFRNFDRDNFDQNDGGLNDDGRLNAARVETLVVLHDGVMFVVLVLVVFVGVGMVSSGARMTADVGRFEVMVREDVPGFPGDLQGPEETRERESEEGATMNNELHASRILHWQGRTGERIREVRVQPGAAPAAIEQVGLVVLTDQLAEFMKSGRRKTTLQEVSRALDRFVK